ncbi:radical SAM family heme chaperone HemW [Leptotrichia sp. OH3620_COT-345]|uniref:radical SAM family heme chaperone HemW n=1 Tax=Leptotrichia sp. OH3620_COT-345 TaxID=2491048 RepID=UPI000F64D90C|nr:radical SAM family heme chaperone HemW [Leptotrichia sp. OH3620_COT-345]RRD39401.1 radical SAM family heme chaperone HemW [Leptotrichia sp. OH3620_COT-345]
MSKTENKQKTGENIDALYLHIPFCEKKCEYCDFCTFINMEHEYGKYTEALIKELKMYPEYEYDTVYFGGGTPSLLSIKMLSCIMETIKYTRNAEITLELNPNDMTEEKLQELRKIKINRLSIGIQSFQNHILKFIGRLHNGEDAVKVFENARKAGFDNISIDLMFGIPNQNMKDLKKDLEMILQLSPDNVSIYSLIWEEGTVFWSKMQKGLLYQMEQDLEAEMYELIIDFLKANGYEHYEISNFSKKGLAGRHNLKYWKNKQFLGVGMSAASYYKEKRYSNVRNFYKYYKFIDENIFPIDEKSVETVDETEYYKLKNMLGLRLINEGIEYFDDEKSESLLKRGLLEKFNKGTRLRLTRQGILLANDVFMEFI